MGRLRILFFTLFSLFLVACGNGNHQQEQSQKGGLSTVKLSDTISESNEDDNGVEEETAVSSEEDLKIISWNIANLGKSKDYSELSTMAAVLKSFDVVAIQEVVAGPGGSQAVADLVDILSRKGSKWDYAVSDPTSGGKGKERYAFLWKPSRAQLKGRPWLDQNIELEIDREPFLARFKKGSAVFTIASFHAVPQSKYPNAEIELLKDFPKWYPDDHLILVGDFNAGSDEYGADALVKAGFKDAMNNTRTTIKMKPDKEGRHLANPFDHIYFEKSEISIKSKGTVDFTDQFSDLKSARLISDHIPVWASVSVR